MNGLIYFWIAFVALLLVIFYCDRKYSLLRDISIADKKPYSFSRVQLAWWTTIVLAAFISIVVSHNGIPTFDTSTLILLGISSATTATARTIDISDQKNQKVTRSQDKDGQWFLSGYSFGCRRCEHTSSASRDLQPDYWAVVHCSSHK